MDEDEIDKAVVAYLKKKGFKQTELAFQEEQHTKNTSSNSTTNSLSDSDIAKHLLAFAEPESISSQYHEEYRKLRSWAYGSLDLYKHELVRILYPVFVHSFMNLVVKGHIEGARAFLNSFREDQTTHLRDLQKLEGVLSPSHLEEMEFAHTLRQSKVNLKMCEYSYELLLQYLQKSQSITMLGVINEHINFQVSPGQPSSISDDAEVFTLVGNGQDTTSLINQKEIHWGLLEDTIEDRLEKVGSLLSDSEKADGETKEGDLDETKKRPAEGGKQGPSLKKSKKEKVVGATGKTVRSDGNSVPAAPRVKAGLTLPIIPVEVEHSILEDLRNRVQLSSVALPSVSFYTFLNTHNGLNCSTISSDGSLVAGGFSDSSLKVWDMAKLGQRAVSSNLQGEHDSINDYMQGATGRRPYTLFRGHSGPIHSACFSPLGDFVLSSSSDTTIRLWSTRNINANLVCYKGHNYPVWDVQFSPAGHYFASASHDRTARIWSMDRIQPLRIMAGHLSDVDCVQWHSNCNYIATGSSDKTIRLWDVQSGECVRVFIGHRNMILTLAMSPDGRYMASGDEDGTIMLWDLSTGRCVTPLMGHSGCVWSLGFSGEGSLLASGSSDCTIKLWDVNTSTKVPKTDESKIGNPNRLRALKTLITKSSIVCSVKFSRRNLLFAAGSLLQTG